MSHRAAPKANSAVRSTQEGSPVRHRAAPKANSAVRSTQELS